MTAILEDYCFCCCVGLLDANLLLFHGKTGTSCTRRPGKEEAPERRTGTKLFPVVHLQREESVFSFHGNAKSHLVFPEERVIVTHPGKQSFKLLLLFHCRHHYAFTCCCLSGRVRGCGSFPRAGTREGNWGSPLSLTSLFPGSFVLRTGCRWGSDLVAYCSEHVVRCSVYWTIWHKQTAQQYYKIF